MTVANGMTTKTEVAGQTRVTVEVNGGKEEIEIKDVKYTPNIAVNILSVSQIAKKGYSVLFDENGCKIKDRKGNLTATGVEEDGIYKLVTETCQNGKAYAVKGKSGESEILWHRRLGHLNRGSMKTLTNLVDGVNYSELERQPCLSCIKGKQHRQPFPRSERKTNQILELVHSDLCGPMSTTSIGGSKYFLTLIDDYSRKTFVYFLEHKSEAFDIISEFINMVELQTGKKVKKLRSDNGTEYVNRRMQNMFKNKGIIKVHSRME